MEIWAYEMCYDKKEYEPVDIECIPFDAAYISDYKTLYNEAFFPMRKALDIKPYNWYSDDEAIIKKSADIFLLVEDGRLIGSVACNCNEIDDLFVNTKETKKGYGRKLLLWAVKHIRKKNDLPITLHVAEWNKGALKLYEDAGFKIKNKERVR
ncbi:MAG: GNAT family N-acetyltransferase [Lachnospiraceae bacterium]|nr:GNAT family N-acetyltransferase [Lachnospiraceae bacterium]